MLEPGTPRVARWGVPAVVIGLGAFAGLIALLSLVLPSVARATRADPYAVSFWATLALDGAAIGIVVLVVRFRGSGGVVRDVGLRFRPIDLATGPGVGVVAKIVGGVLAAIVVFGLGLSTRGMGSNIPFERGSPWSWLLIGLIGCLLAPFAEELLFRGLVLRGIQLSILRGRARGEPWAASPARRRAAAGVAIGISATLFAAFHLYEAQTPAMAVAIGVQILVVGVAHGLLTVLTGRLGPAILSHVTNNAIVFGVLIAFPQLARGLPS